MSRTNKSSGRQLVHSSAVFSKIERKAIVNILAGRIETKFFTTSSGNATIPTTGLVLNLSNMTQGTGDTNRVGDECIMTRLSFKYSIQAGATGLIAAADEYNAVRVIIFKWREDSTIAVPIQANVLIAASSGISTNQMHAFDQRELVSILYDETHVVYNTPIWNGAAVQWNHGPLSNFSLARLKIIGGARLGKINFTGNSTLGNGQVYVLITSDSAFAPNPTCDFSSILEFKDG